MALHGSQSFDTLGKALDFVTKSLFGLGKGNSAPSHGGTHSAHNRPSSSTCSPMTSNPLIPGFLLLLVVFVLLFSSPVQGWLDKPDALPTWAQIFSFSAKKQANPLPTASESVRVWAKKQSGFYYCHGGTLFGNKPGKMMAQVDAIMSGFRPFGGEYCAGSQPLVASAGKPSFKNQERHVQTNNPAPRQASHAQISNTPPDISQAEGRIHVWVIKEFGSYYCRGEVLFGDEPGKLMSQADAMTAGYRPSEGHCSNEKPKETVADNLMFGSQLPPAAVAKSPQEVEPLALMKKAPKVSKAEAGAKVWVKTEFGFYYCHDDVLFGKKPGKLMTQADALTAGYHPSDSRCSNDKPTRAATQIPPSRSFADTK